MSRLLLLSGGLDSTALAAMVRPEHCLGIDYGQVAADAEHRAAREVARELDLPFVHLNMPASALAAGLMSRDADTTSAVGVTAPEWWPFRNQLLITIAAAWGVTRGFHEVLLGTVASDGTRHADGTAEFRIAIDQLLSLQEGGMHVSAPASGLTTDELLTRSQVPEHVLAWTHSCHRANLPCANCPGCVKRSESLHRAGLLQ
ncbi:7-cyano-7-deazaguanine synthase [Cellulomonas cellasea]|uniref:7-cyano-7-deazaguanine synthase n=1 Tax=Cellulomonas cellasea TaxID=43670 RepID=A0A7W4UH74_9CELL|nr:7-cyano-7-deazaguanine synthase [Cellulomonas cellasea]MBB2924119.1 7-cyano-7-deazaguanine synthase [Cellulomonas cellasea]